MGETRVDILHLLEDLRDAYPGGLAVRVNGGKLTTLQPTYRDAFSNEAANLDFTRDARGRITGFLLQAGRVRDLRFVRQR